MDKDDVRRLAAQVYDKLHGTPCEQIRHQQEVERLKEDARELWAALNALSFECDGVISTSPPSRETYNRTFAVMQRHWEKYGPAKTPHGGGPSDGR